MDPAAGTQLKVLDGHTAPVWALGWNGRNGERVLASSGQDGTIRLWDLDSGVQVQILESYATSVAALAWGSLGGRSVLASASGDGRVRLWDRGQDPAEHTSRDGFGGKVTALAWGTLGGRSVLASGGDGKVRLWDLNAGKHLRDVEGHGWVRSGTPR